MLISSLFTSTRIAVSNVQNSTEHILSHSKSSRIDRTTECFQQNLSVLDQELSQMFDTLSSESNLKLSTEVICKIKSP